MHMRIWECGKDHLSWEDEVDDIMSYPDGSVKARCGNCGTWCRVVADSSDHERLKSIMERNKFLENENRKLEILTQQ